MDNDLLVYCAAGDVNHLDTALQIYKSVSPHLWNVAVAYGQFNVVMCLLKHAIEGCTEETLRLAVLRKDIDMIQYILQWKPDLNRDTSIELAKKFNNHTKILEILQKCNS